MRQNCHMLSSLIALFLILGGGMTMSAQGPPVRLTAPGTLGFQGSAFRTFGSFDNREQGSSYTQVVAVPYNFSTDFQAGLIMRYSFINPNGRNSFNGLNNSTLFLKHQLVVKNDVARTFRLSALIRQSFPTGKEMIAPELYSTFIGISAGDISTKRGFYTNLGYVLRTNDFSDVFQYDLAVGLPLLPQVYPLKQFNTFLELNGSLDLDGNHVLSLSPGIQFIKGIFLIETSLQLPLIQPSGLNEKEFNLILGTRILM